jgi:hypothetical protein
MKTLLKILIPASILALIFTSLICLHNTDTPGEHAFYGKVVMLSGDVVPDYFSDIQMIQYVDCDKDGKSGFDDHLTESEIRLYSKPALAARRLLFARVGDVVAIHHVNYKQRPDAYSSNYNHIDIALPVNSKPVPQEFNSAH